MGIVVSPLITAVSPFCACLIRTYARIALAYMHRDYRAHRAGSGPPRPNRYAKKSAGLHDFRLTPLSLVHGVRLSAHGEPVRQQPVTVLRHD